MILSATAHQMGKKLNSDVIWHLTEEAMSAEIEDSIYRSNTAMLAATSKARGGKGKDQDTAIAARFIYQLVLVAHQTSYIQNIS